MAMMILALAVAIPVAVGIASATAVATGAHAKTEDARSAPYDIIGVPILHSPDIKHLYRTTSERTRKTRALDCLAKEIDVINAVAATTDAQQLIDMNQVRRAMLVGASDHLKSLPVLGADQPAINADPQTQFDGASLTCHVMVSGAGDIAAYHVGCSLWGRPMLFELDGQIYQPFDYSIKNRIDYSVVGVALLPRLQSRIDNAAHELIGHIARTYYQGREKIPCPK